MALRDLLECTTTLTKIFLDDSWDDDFDIYHKIDFSEFNNTPFFEHHTPVQKIPTNLSCRAKTIVRKLNQDCCALKLIIDTEITQKDLTRPVLLEWNVSVINENTEQSRLLGGTNNAPGGNLGEFSNDLQINVSELKDFIINDSLIFKWTIRLMPGPDQVGVNEEEATPIELTVFKPGEPNVKKHLHIVLSQTQNQRNAMKSSRFQEAVVHIDKVVSDCKDDDVETDSIGRRMDDVEKRVDKLRESFVEQRGEIKRFMSDLEDAIKRDECYKRDVGEAVTKRDSYKYTALPPSFQLHGKGIFLEKEMLVEKDSGINRKFNFLLIGNDNCGKRATRNSILQMEKFLTGLGKNTFNKTNIERSSVKVLGYNNEIAVVELPNEDLENVDEAFELCPDGFDAILCVAECDNYYKRNIFHCETELEDISLFDGVLKSFGIMIKTRSYIYDFDYPNTMDYLSIRMNPQLNKLSEKVEERVLLFDNTPNSIYKQTVQLASLLYTVLNLPMRPTRVTRNDIITPVAILRSQLLSIHKKNEFLKINARKRHHFEDPQEEKEMDRITLHASVKVLLDSRHHPVMMSVPLEKKVANLEGKMLIHNENIKSLSERLDKVETKEELKLIQLEVNKLQNVEAEKEQEIQKLKSQVREKEDERANLLEMTLAQVRHLETKISSLKEKETIGENELQQYRQDKAELKRKVQALLMSTEKEFRKIKEEASASNAKIRELWDSRQKDEKIHDAKIKQLVESYHIIESMLKSMRQGPNIQSPHQPTRSPQVPQTAPAPVPSNEPSNEPSIKPTDPNIKNPKSGEQPSAGPSTQHAEPKILRRKSVRQQKLSAGPSKQSTEPKAQVSKAPRAQLSLKEPYKATKGKSPNILGK